jgi:hypothetical protein
MVMHKDALAWLELGDTFTHSRDHTHGFVPRIERCARAHIPLHHIAGTQTTGPHLYQQFTRPNLRDRQVYDAHIVVGMIFYS